MKSTFFILFSLLSTLSWAQIKVITLDTEKEGYPPSEPSIAISGKNKDHIVAGAILDKVYSSLDGGETWTTSRLESEIGVFGDPVIHSDDKGRFYYFHLSNPAEDEEKRLDRIVVQYSKDNGSSWSAGTSIGENHPKDQDKPQAFIDSKGKLYACWTQFDKYGSNDPADQSNILIALSANGQKWSDPIRINKVPGDCLDGDGTVMGAYPVVSPDGKIYVIWSHNEQIYLDRSFDGGKMWLKNEDAVMKQPGGWNIDIPGLSRANGLPSLGILANDKLVGNGRLFLLWSDQKNGEDDTDIWFAHSNSKGDSFTTPLRVNDDEPGRHQFFPAMAVDQTTGYVYILFYDRRNTSDLATEVYLAYSTDGGISFQNVKISETPFVLPEEGVFLGDYISISASKERIAAIWTEYRESKTEIRAAVFDHKDLEQ